MERIIIIVARCAVLMMLATTFATPAWTQGKTSKQPAAAIPCAGGTWAPALIQYEATGDPAHPDFRSVYALSCGGNVHLVQFTNNLHEKRVELNMLGKTAVSCSGGVWTPKPVQDIGSHEGPPGLFHTLWGLSCGGNVYMIRISNALTPDQKGEQIVVDAIKQTAIGCSGGIWTPTAVQEAHSGNLQPYPPHLEFHTMWGLSCGKTVYMIRFSNVVNGNEIVVDAVAQKPVR
jgi:hypothetical protein